jgi:hypothetical protein
MVERASLHCQRNDAFFMKQVHQSSQGSPITSPWTLLRGAISEVAPRVFKRDSFFGDVFLLQPSTEVSNKSVLRSLRNEVDALRGSLTSESKTERPENDAPIRESPAKPIRDRATVRRTACSSKERARDGHRGAAARDRGPPFRSPRGRPTLLPHHAFGTVPDQ